MISGIRVELLHVMFVFGSGEAMGVGAGIAHPVCSVTGKAAITAVRRMCFIWLGGMVYSWWLGKFVASIQSLLASHYCSRRRCPPTCNSGSSGITGTSCPAFAATFIRVLRPAHEFRHIHAFASGYDADVGNRFGDSLKIVGLLVQISCVLDALADVGVLRVVLGKPERLLPVGGRRVGGCGLHGMPWVK